MGYFAEHGHPVRTTISEMGSLVLAALLELNETQSGILYACFAIADDEGMLLLDLKDLRATLSWRGEHAKELRADYGNISPASLGAIQRRLLVMQEQEILINQSLCCFLMKPICCLKVCQKA